VQALPLRASISHAYSLSYSLALLRTSKTGHGWRCRRQEDLEEEEAPSPNAAYAIRQLRGRRNRLFTLLSARISRPRDDVARPRPAALPKSLLPGDGPRRFQLDSLVLPLPRPYPPHSQTLPRESRLLLLCRLKARRFAFQAPTLREVFSPKPLAPYCPNSSKPLASKLQSLLLGFLLFQFGL
jgi:hypothetical protein